MTFAHKLTARLKDRRVLPWILVVVALLAVHGPALVGHALYALDPGVFNDDARQQIFPFFRYSDRELFRRDYLGDYFLDCLPVGFRAFYTAGAAIWDAAPLSKIVPYGLLLVTVASVAVAASKIGSRWSALASASLVLGAGVFMARMGGGLPRAFGFPLLAMGIALLASGRLRLLAALVPIAASFYPTSTIPLGLSLAFAALLLPARDRGDLAGEPFGRRLALLVGAAVITVAVVVPTALSSRKYGRIITPAMVQDYPEAGPGGRYSAGDRAPFEPFFPESVDAVRGALQPAGEPFVKPLQQWLSVGGSKERLAPRRAALHDLLFAIILLGGASLVSRSAAARRVLLLGVAAFAGHLVARFVAPYFYLPTRYLEYPLPLVALVLLPAGAAEIARVLPDAWRERARPAAAAATALLLLAFIGGTGSSQAGLVRFANAGDPFFAAVSRLPKDALIAAWPQGPIESVPYVSRRQALLTWELHQAFHTGFVDESRRRMRAVVDAYFATSPEPLQRLRDDFGVTHLIVHPAHLHGAGPSYFAPYGPWVAEAKQRAAGQGYEVLRLLPTLATFRNDRYAILDLSRLPPAGPGVAPHP